MFAIATPARQTAEDTIVTLSGRLSSSTLLEDRRAAVLGLKSFASSYPATVASNALRGLIGCLNKDGQDIDTTQATLQTLLQLFNPNENSPEASEEIALWLADEFTQRQDNVTLLLDLLDTTDFYSRLYSLKLLSAILSSRTERMEECIFTAPLGISRLVAILDDRREAIRNEGLALLTYLTPTSAELQKRVAFEDAFERIFNIIKLEGSLLHGDRIVEDCLILLANLLRLNISNQSFFRETGCVPKVARILSEAIGEQSMEREVAEWAKIQMNRNIYALLAVLRLFLVTGAIGTHTNQATFWQHGVLDYVLKLAFSRSTEVQIKAEALTTCADLIRGNPNLQEGFAQLQVTSVLDERPIEGDESSQPNGVPQVYVIDGLLDLTLSISSIGAFDSRLAACECIKAYFFNHPVIRKHFLRRAIEGHTRGADETANVLTTLLQPLDSQGFGDPYRYWLAAVILFHLIFEDSDAKNLVMRVTEGDAENGEEVVTCIQSLTGNLITGIQKNVDDRVVVAYLMLLCGWLFEDLDGVNDFLGEGSNLQSLVQVVSSTSSDGAIVQGLCAMLLGIIYEFSTKDSPVSRKTIHPLLASQLGREKYIDRLTKLRSHSMLRDFEVLPQKLSSSSTGGLPLVFFDKTFVEFVKDNFSRLLRAIDRDPGMEIPILAKGVQKGISRDMVDSLRSQLEEKAKSLQKAEEELLSLEKKLSQEQAEHRKTRDASAFELSRIKQVNDALQMHHNEEINNLRAEQSRGLQDYQKKLEHTQKVAETNAERTKKHVDAEIKGLHGTIQTLETELAKSNKNHVKDLQTAHEEYTTKLAEQSSHLQRTKNKLEELESQSKIAIDEVAKAKAALAKKESEKQAIQNELDDLLMVFGDLEEKVTKYKERLKTLGESVSDGEEEESEEDSEDDDVD